MTKTAMTLPETDWRFLDRLHPGFTVFGPGLRLLFANRTARSHWPIMYSSLDDGAALFDAVGLQIRSLFPHLDEATLQVRQSLVMDAIRKCSDLDMVTATGRHVVTTYSRLDDGRIIGVAHDVTDLVKQEVSLKDARRDAVSASEAKSEFLATMSHEIRTPLNGVIGMAEALQHRQLDAAEKEMVDTIVDSSHTMLVLLNDILDMSKIEAGRLDINPVVENVRERICWLKRTYTPIARKKGLTLKVAFDPKLPKYLAFDTTRVRQCIDNLVFNALKFTSKGGVTIAVMAGGMSRDGRITVTVHVCDTGIGIAPEKRERVFSSFEQADGSTTHRFGGSGLGLAISRKLARLMGGDITCTSEPGQGSVFSLSFETRLADMPKDGTASLRVSPLRETFSLKGICALVVDDNEINLRVARAAIEPLGVEVVDASSGQEALDILARHVIDIVLLDSHMPGMDGPDTLRHIRQSGMPWSIVPVIAVTADAMEGDRAKYLAMGMDDYIAKPILERDLMTALSRIKSKLRTRSSRRSPAFSDIVLDASTASNLHKLLLTS